MESRTFQFLNNLKKFSTSACWFLSFFNIFNIFLAGTGLSSVLVRKERNKQGVAESLKY